MSNVALQAEGVHAGYGAADVLGDITFGLLEGEVLGVVGPNGSGKSTLLRALTGLLPLRAGRVMIQGTELGSLRARARARLCAVQPQVEAPLFDFTVRQFALLGRHAHRSSLAPASGRDHEAVRQALAHADLEELSDRSIRSLSTGEWQRALLARALAQEAPVLLLDEPAAHLDPGHRHAVHVLLRELARSRGIAVLCISHDLNLASEFCDRLMILSGGKVRALGTPEEVMGEDLLQDVFRCPALRLAANPYTGKPGTVFIP